MSSSSILAQLQQVTEELQAADEKDSSQRRQEFQQEQAEWEAAQPARAAGIIAGILDTALAAARSGSTDKSIMTLDFADYQIPAGEHPDRLNREVLRGAAAIVYDHCVSENLSPRVIFSNHQTKFVIKINWDKKS